MTIRTELQKAVGAIRAYSRGEKRARLNPQRPIHLFPALHLEANSVYRAKVGWRSGFLSGRERAAFEGISASGSTKFSIVLASPGQEEKKLFCTDAAEVLTIRLRGEPVTGRRRLWLKHSIDRIGERRRTIPTDFSEEKNASQKMRSIVSDLIAFFSPWPWPSKSPATDGPSSEKKAEGSSARVHVTIPTFNRPDGLAEILQDLNNAAGTLNVEVDVHDDAGSIPANFDADDYPNLRSVTLIRHVRNHGKKGYWQLVNTVLERLSGKDADLFYYLADDVRAAPDFFERSISIWKSIKDDSLVTLNLLRDSRAESTCWTNVEAGLVETAEHYVLRTQWVDMLMMFDVRFLRALDFKINEVPQCRWDSDPLLSSGVGQQISLRLHALEKSMYLVPTSLLIHDDRPSQMNPEERLRNPLVSIDAV